MVSVSTYQNRTKINLNVMLGPICMYHPNICLYVNDMLSVEEIKEFNEKELPIIYEQWSNIETRQSLGDFSDAYWISKLWLKINPIPHHPAFYNTIIIRCKNIVDDVPNIDIKDIQGCLLWNKIECDINVVKQQIIKYQAEHEEEDHQTQTQTQTQQPTSNQNTPCMIDPYNSSLWGPIITKYPELITMAQGHIHEYEDGYENEEFDNVCEKLFEVIEQWMIVTYNDSPIEQWLFAQDGKTKYTKEQAIGDITDTYWILQTYNSAVTLSNTNNTRDGNGNGNGSDSPIEKSLVDIIQLGENVCKYALIIDQDLKKNIFNLLHFCDSRARLRKLFSAEFKMLDSIDRLHDAIYNMEQNKTSKGIKDFMNFFSNT